MDAMTAPELRTTLRPVPVRSSRARAAWLALAIALAAGTGALGYRAGQGGLAVPAWVPDAVSRAFQGEAASRPVTGPIIYYRHPDAPTYSAVPRRTEDGRDFVPVRASEDVGFDDPPKPAAAEVLGGEGKRVLYYRNPMGLPDTSPTPKKDSMGMDYIPVFEGEVQDGNVVRISPGKLQRTGVRSEPVERRVVSRPVRVPGTIQLDERRVTVVATRSEAFVDKVENVTTGDIVRKGQPLVHVYSPEINAAAAQLIANPGFDGSRRRLQNLNVPADTIAEMERTRKVPAAITWTAPRDGVVLERVAVEGMRAAAGDTLFRIGDISLVWVMADVPEHDLGSVKLGQPATVRVRSLPGRTFTGKVSAVYPQINRETRTARIRIELPNPEGALLADMYADVEIATGAGKPVVAVPDDAVIDTGARQIVLIDVGEGRFEPREVKLGARGGGYVEIQEGVAEADRVVVSANFLIDAESNLKAALQALAPAAPPPAAVAPGEERRP